MTFAESRAPVAGFKKRTPSSQTYVTAPLPPLPARTSRHCLLRSPDALSSRPAKRQKVEIIVISDDEDDTAQVPETGPKKQYGYGDTGGGVRQLAPKQDTAVLRKEHYKSFIREHVVPHISCAVTKLPTDKYQVNEIAQKTSCIIAKTPRFYSHYIETKGQFSEADKLALAQQVPTLVERLSQQAKYQLPLTPSLRNSPVSSLRSPATLDIPSDAYSPPSSLSPSRGPLLRERQCLPSPPAELIPEQVPGLAPRQRRPLRPRTRNEVAPSSRLYLQITERPYLTAEERQQFINGITSFTFKINHIPTAPIVLHVDFSPEEIEQLIAVVNKHAVVPIPTPMPSLADICHTHDIPRLVENDLLHRSKQDITNFCKDIKAGHAANPLQEQVLSLKKFKAPKVTHDDSKLSTLLFARELEGNAGFGRTRRFVNFQNEFSKAHEDALDLRAEFTNCAGDIFTIAWISNYSFICGTTTHSDAANQQYNKPGNLLLCSTICGELRAFVDHRIPRPLVEKGENSTEAMRESQDAWLYSSVVASDYDVMNDIAYTSSFDGTVKSWRVDANGKSMKALSTWKHPGRVNLVVAAKDGSGRVASATNQPTRAIRIYQFDRSDPNASPYSALSGAKNAVEASVKWAYVPATMQWGRAPGTQHLLLVGYSPRSFTDEEDDIPEEKQKAGEILLWDAKRRCSIPVLTATTTNVFEVAWHPTQPVFVVGTSPCGTSIEHGVKTQIRVFQRDMDGAYAEMQTLDCVASDINELTIVPNSVRDSYVTAACTDGRVYVWDTAQGDRPIHILKHGRPLDDIPHQDREKYDTGAKFAAWGTNNDRLYTGSSDGVVKVWNIRKKKHPFIRNLLEAPGPITYGSFSPDHFKLAVGDATGRVFFLSVDDRDELDSHSMKIPGRRNRIRRPRPFLPHREPPNPSTPTFDNYIATYTHNTYIASSQIIIHPNPFIGAIQGPRYSTSNHFLREAHLDKDPNMPLLAEFQRHQREAIDASLGVAVRTLKRLKIPENTTTDQSVIHQHSVNQANSTPALAIEADELAALEEEGAIVNVEDTWSFEYED